MALSRTTRSQVRATGLRYITNVKFPVKKHIARYKKTIGEEILMFAAFSLQKRVRQSLGQQGTGKHHPGLKYQSALPGKPPAVQTGDLRNSFVAGSRSIGAIRDIPDGMAINFRQATMNMSKVYGPKLEKTHPFFKPSIQRMRNDKTLEKIANRWLKKSTDKSNMEFKQT